MTEPWFDPNRFGAIFGAIVGGGGGSLLGLVGAAAGYLLPRGRGHMTITALTTIGAIVGVISGLFGFYALANGQPYGIWYPPFLIGLIFTPLSIMLMGMVRRSAIISEHRKMEARDLREF